jgi:thiol-disulfide isomerase/thioredoxin
MDSKKLFKILAPVGAIIGLVLIAVVVIKKQSQSAFEGTGQPAIEVGGQLPDFDLVQFSSGKEMKFSELDKKVVLVNFWATWCEACMVEMPSIVKLRKAYESKGFEVLALNVDENPEAVLPKTLNRLGLDFPIYVDRDQKLADLFDVHAIPLTVILDRNRKILFIETGERDWNGSDIHAKLEAWLAAGA